MLYDHLAELSLAQLRNHQLTLVLRQIARLNEIAARGADFHSNLTQEISLHRKLETIISSEIERVQQIKRKVDSHHLSAAAGDDLARSQEMVHEVMGFVDSTLALHSQLLIPIAPDLGVLVARLLEKTNSYLQIFQIANSEDTDLFAGKTLTY